MNRAVLLARLAVGAFLPAFIHAVGLLGMGRAGLAEGKLLFLLFGALRALVLLQDHFPELTHWVQHVPDGTIRIGLQGGRCLAWVRFVRGRVFCGLPPLPGPVRAELSFKDARVGLWALTETADVPAAIGLGEVGIRGFFPLVQQLGEGLEILKAYALEGGGKRVRIAR
jgi:hypothetical protein